MAAATPEKRYEYICKQLEREDALYHVRLNSCVGVNIALGAAAATQFSAGDISLRKYLLIVVCCLVGFLITRGIHQTNRIGGRHVSYLRRMFDQMDAAHPGRFPKPYYVNPASAGTTNFGRLTGIPFVFQALWIGTFILISAMFFGLMKV